MTEEAKPKKPLKMLQRTFALPASVIMATFFNDIAGLGLSTAQMGIMGAVAVGYAFAEVWRDVSRMKHKPTA